MDFLQGASIEQDVVVLPPGVNTVALSREYLDGVINRIGGNFNLDSWRQRILASKKNSLNFDEYNAHYNREMFRHKALENICYNVSQGSVASINIQYRPYWSMRNNDGIHTVDAVNGSKHHNSHENVLQDPLAAIIDDAERHGMKTNVINDIPGTTTDLIEPKMELEYANRHMQKIGGWGLEFWFIPHMVLTTALEGTFTMREYRFHDPESTLWFFFKKAYEDTIEHRISCVTNVSETYDAFYGKKTKIVPSIDDVTGFDILGETHQLTASNLRKYLTNINGNHYWMTSSGATREDTRGFWRL